MSHARRMGLYLTALVLGVWFVLAALLILVSLFLLRQRFVKAVERPTHGSLVFSILGVFGSLWGYYGAFTTAAGDDKPVNPRALLLCTAHLVVFGLATYYLVRAHVLDRATEA